MVLSLRWGCVDECLLIAHHWTPLHIIVWYGDTQQKLIKLGYRWSFERNNDHFENRSICIPYLIEPVRQL